MLYLAATLDGRTPETTPKSTSPTSSTTMRKSSPKRMAYASRRGPSRLDHRRFRIIGEPTNSGIEGGCNGTIRFDVVTHGVAAHSARAWMGENAIHKAADILNRLTPTSRPP